MQVITNAPYLNRIQLTCNPYIGPFLQDGVLGSFDPRRDLEVYIDGSLTPIDTFAFDSLNNRYLMYTLEPINLQGVVQVIHHIPDPPFNTNFTTGWGQLWGDFWGSLPGLGKLPGFALVGSYSPVGDSDLPPAASFISIPNPVAANTAVLLVWNTINIPNIKIAGNNGVDYQPHGFSTGLLPSNGSGLFSVTSGFTQSIILNLYGFDKNGGALGGYTPVHLTITVT